jgi:hypothetical protein
MKDWLTLKQEEDARRKAEDAALVAEFVAAGKVKHLGYVDKAAMNKIQKNWNRIPHGKKETDTVRKNEEYCIFSMDGSVKV